MAYKSLFFNSTQPTDTGEGATSFAQYFGSLVRSGVLVTYDASALTVKTVPGTMTVELQTGNAFMFGYGFFCTETETFSILAGSALPRLDRFILRLDFGYDATGNDRAGSIYPAILAGTPGGLPAPLTRNNEVWEICLAEIPVVAEATNLDGAEIIDTRPDTELCGFASFFGAPPYQPPTDVPALVWDYVVFPESLTPEQRTIVEGNPAWMDMVNSSRIIESFNRIAPQIGDTLTTVRTDLDDSWLLCNGDALDAAFETAYPELSNKIRITPYGKWRINSRTLGSAQGIAHGNDAWVASGSNGAFYKLGSPDGEWTAASGVAKGYGVAYGDGYWATIAEATGHIMYKQGSPAGAWSTAGTYAGITGGIAYGNGYWVAVGQNGALCYRQGTPAGAWTSQGLGTAITLTSVSYANGYWVAVSTAGTVSYKQGSPVGAWTTYNNGTYALHDITYGDGYWCAVGAYGTIRYTTDISSSSSWVVRTVGTSTEELYSVLYADGFWLIGGYSGLVYVSRYLDTSWTTVPSGTNGIGGFAHSSTAIVLAASGGTAFVTRSLPEISLSSTYTYIKAKEAE